MKKIIGYSTALFFIIAGVLAGYVSVFQTSAATGKPVANLLVERGFALGTVLTFSPGFFLVSIVMAIIGLILFLLTRSLKPHDMQTKTLTDL